MGDELKVGKDDPVCPHCKMDPARYSINLTRTTSGLHIYTVFCANRQCRRIHSASVTQGKTSNLVHPFRA
jgi:hypothetical protein